MSEELKAFAKRVSDLAHRTDGALAADGMMRLNAKDVGALADAYLSRTPTEAEPGEAEVERVAQAIDDNIPMRIALTPEQAKRAARAAIAALRSTTPASERPLDMCNHGADRGSYCGHCGGYSQGEAK